MTRPLHSIIDPSDMPRTARSYADPDHAYDLARERRMMTQAERDAEDREYIEEARREAQVAAVEAWAAKAYHHGGTVDGKTVDILDGFIREGRRMALVQYLDGTRATVPVASVEVNR